jgi:hypothetical protein
MDSRIQLLILVKVLVQYNVGLRKEKFALCLTKGKCTDWTLCCFRLQISKIYSAHPTYYSTECTMEQS